MNARDVMSKPVVSVHPDTTTREIARLLVEKAITAIKQGFHPGRRADQG